MSKNVITGLIIILVIIAGVLGWWYFTQQHNTPAKIILSSDKSITSFGFAGLTPQANGVVDNSNYRIDVTVSSKTSITGLTPIITVSPYATVSPVSGLSQNFTNPVIYTVTAQDGSTQNYTVVVTPASVK